MFSWFANWGGEIEGDRVVRLVQEQDISMPAQSRMIELLEYELDVPVWADVSKSPPNEDNAVVVSKAGEWIKASSVFQRRTRDLDIYVYASTSDAAERLRDRAAVVCKRSQNFILRDIDEIPGGYIDDTQQFMRGISITVRAVL